MLDFKKYKKQLRLSLLFAAVFFLITLFTMSLVFVGVLLLFKFHSANIAEMRLLPLLLFALVSLFIGTVFAAVFSSRPLKPLREIIRATDQIANGDYSARIDFKRPEELRRLARRFNHMAEELGSVELLRNDFVNNFSHEFKTPIVSIRGFAKILKREDLTQQERDEYLDVIIRESERLTTLATNVLNLSKIEQQSILTDKKKLNASEQIRLVIALLESKWHKKQISFAFACEEVFVTGDEDLLKQVWINLVDNAVKFSPENGIVEIRSKISGGQAFYTFTNQSEPLPAEAAARVFDKFYQGEASHTTTGNGLGLTIAKRIVDLHGGSICMESSEAAGTSVTVALPVC